MAALTALGAVAPQLKVRIHSALPGRIVPHEGARYAVALARPDD